MDRLRANRKVFKEFAFRETDSKPSEHSDQHEFEATTLCQTIRDLETVDKTPVLAIRRSRFRFRGIAGKEHINNLEKIPRHAARVVSNDHHQSSSVTEMLKALDWQTLECRRQASRLTTLYKVDKGSVIINSAHLQPAPTRTRRTHDKQFARLQSNKDICLNSFFPRTIKQWNSLSQQTVSAPSADAFHQRVLRTASCFLP